MRLHRLQVAAFGPFTGEVEVDLDRLSEAGLFLLSGPTGAGKTSVLDAVCFALYGDVPGDRSGAKRLRSDRAAPTTPTRVQLEATLAGRRFRFVRSPAWERPKKRGSGTTTAPAQVSVSELVDGTWDPLTTRADEAGDLVGRLLGMSLGQFTQVALLPQGRFATFLRARSEERHALLQQLFHTGRFEQVERWLRDRRLELGRESGRHQDVVAAVLSRLSEVAETPAPADWDAHDPHDPHDLGEPADDGVLVPWAEALRDTAVEAAGVAAARAGVAAAAEGERRATLEQARVAHDRAERLRRVRAEQARLSASADDHAHGVRRLDAGRRAAPVLPLEAELTGLTASVSTARASAEDAWSELAAALGRDPVDLDATTRDTLGQLATARAAGPRATELVRLQATRARLEDEGADVGERRAEAARLRPRQEERLDSARTAETDAREAALLLDVRRGEAEDVAAAVRAGEQATRLRVEVDAARIAWLDARSATLDLRDRLADLQQARVDGMAAELAVSLAVGASCPVCGSHEHPAKAPGAPGAPDAAAEREARAAVGDAAVTEAAHDDLVRGLQARLAALEARAGDDPVEELERRLHRARAEVADLTVRARRHSDLVTAREAAEQECVRRARREQDLAAREAALQAELRSVSERLDVLDAELARLLAGSGHDTLDDWVDHLELVEARCAAAAEAARLARETRTATAAARSRLERAVAEAGFETAADAVAAGLDPAGLSALDGVVTAHERAETEVNAALRELGAPNEPDEPGGPDGPEGPVPAARRLATAEADHAAALDELAAARGEAEAGGARARRLGDLAADLDRACRAWAPVRADLGLTSALASFCEGKSGDNQLRMRLSAYVLAYRLTQVVDAANERLTSMSDQRYRLEHTADRGVGETRGGLSLLVRDDWSGEARDPATLSGGETFVVSLALALGLADVIAHESGGAALDTLFVDEGFGSLDAETLDDVMDTLDALRDGGRVVGVVSHVAEMRDRIPTQLVVAKSRSGSTLTIAG